VDIPESSPSSQFHNLNFVDRNPLFLHAGPELARNVLSHLDGESHSPIVVIPLRACSLPPFSTRLYGFCCLLSDCPSMLDEDFYYASVGAGGSFPRCFTPGFLQGAIFTIEIYVLAPELLPPGIFFPKGLFPGSNPFLKGAWGFPCPKKGRTPHPRSPEYYSESPDRALPLLTPPEKADLFRAMVFPAHSELVCVAGLEARTPKNLTGEGC